MASTFQYPSVVSRTLDIGSGKSLKTIVAMHDRQISDADLNAIQDLQTLKLARFITDHGVTSGGTTRASFQFNTNNPLTFFIPAFDVLFNGEIVSVQGQLSPDLTLNRIQIPAPPPALSAANLALGDEDARLYIVFLELWYQSLDPIVGRGYYQDPLNPGPKFFFPYGGILPDPSNAKALPDDSVDPFQGLFTTERAQIQWRLNVQRVALDYNFAQGAYGFFYTNARIPGANGTLDPGQIVYGQASRPTTVPGVSPLVGVSTFVFTNMGAVNGDTGLWRCGDGNVNNSLGTMDGYSYAMPVAVVFQRNTGNFNLSTNIFGCADPGTAGSGTTATRISGRFDSKLADQVFQSDVVDTRSTVSFPGLDMDDTMRQSFVDLITGNTQLAISRFGDPSGNKSEAVGSLLDYFLVMGPNTSTIATTVGAFDGFANGFSSDTRTFNTVRQIAIAQKAVGNVSGPWVLNDSFAISLPQSSIATITSVGVTALVGNPPQPLIPAALLQGQINVTGLNSKTVTVTFIKSLTGTAFDPSLNPLYVTLGVTYPSGGASLKKIPAVVEGGTLFDNTIGKTLPVFGVSEYLVQEAQPTLTASAIFAINPEFSDIILGTKIWIAVAGSTGTVQTVGGISQTTFVINGKGLNGNLNGLYTTRAWDLATGNFYNVVSRLMVSLPGTGGIQHIVTLSGAVSPNSTVIFSILAQNTAQLAFNAPVRGATQIEETVLFGNAIQDVNFPLDPRVIMKSVSYNSTADANTIVFGANNCVIKGISGDDTLRFIWTKDTAGNLVANPVTSAVFGNGVLTVVIPGKAGAFVLTKTTPFMFVGSILPAFDPLSVLSLQVQYVPYQGEGVLNRDYDILHSEDNALLTTNGTGAAPLIGLLDVYPYNREFPIVAALPSQPSWHDEGLVNSALSSFFDSNFVAMRQNNVEHTFNVPLHTNDFIPPINKDIHKTVRFTAAGSRGFSQAIPHLGFAIASPTPRTVLGQNLQSTQSSITLFVDNVNGLDTNTGLTLQTAKKTISSALAQLPPVLRHPVTIFIHDTGVAFSVSALQNSLEIIALGDGDIRALKQYALSNLSRVIQGDGRLVISRETTATNPVVIDATGFQGFGDGPTSAFYIENSRVILNGIQFRGFTNPAITAYSSDIDMVDCQWLNNVQAGSYVGCNVVIFDRGSLTIPASGTGHVFAQCNVTSSGHALILPASGTAQGAFYAGTRNTTMFLQQHNTGSLSETNIVSTTVVATAQLNSSIKVDATFQTAGSAVLSANSVLLRTVAVDPFQGGVTADTSSSVVVGI